MNELINKNNDQALIDRKCKICASLMTIKNNSRKIFCDECMTLNKHTFYKNKTKTINCKKCGKLITVNVKSRNLCENCKEIIFSELVDRKCKICKKSIKLTRNNRIIYCDDCKNTKEYTIITSGRVYNKKDTFIDVACKMCGKVYIRVKNGASQVYCEDCKKTDEYIKKFKRLMIKRCKFCNVEIIVSLNAAKVCENCLTKHYTFKFTKPHKLLKESINNNITDHKFQTEQYISCNNRSYSIDEIDRDKKIVIFIDGDYWHANPERYNANEKINNRYVHEIWNRDDFVTKTLQQNGYIVMRFWESFIKNNPDLCIPAIKNVLQNYKKMQNIKSISKKIKQSTVIDDYFVKVIQDNDVVKHCVLDLLSKFN